jgi:cytochrome c-type biogenesis protein CcmI
MSVLLAILLALIVAAYVLWPLWRSRRAGAGDDPNDAPANTQAPVQRAEAYLTALRELEFDRALGHLSEADYQELARRYELRAVATLHALEQQSDELDRLIEQAVLALRRRTPESAGHRPNVPGLPVQDGLVCCPACGVFVPAQRFCGACGAALGIPAGGPR